MAKKARALARQDLSRLIQLVRRTRVMLDSDLAKLYGVETGVLIRSVVRNIERFPADFMFQLSRKEFERLRCQFGISNRASRGGRRYMPYVFTEQGVAMLSSVLRSQRAVRVNVEIMRVFVLLRHHIRANEELLNRIDSLEQKYDAQFGAVFEAIRQLMMPPEPSRRRIGFRSERRT